LLRDSLLKRLLKRQIGLNLLRLVSPVSDLQAKKTGGSSDPLHSCVRSLVKAQSVSRTSLKPTAVERTTAPLRTPQASLLGTLFAQRFNNSKHLALSKKFQLELSTPKKDQSNSTQDDASHLPVKR
jgi:hypothetical protein